MRHSPQAFAFLRTDKDLWVFAEGADEGFAELSSPPPEGDYLWAPDFFLEDEKPFLKPKHLMFLSTSELRKKLQTIGSSARHPYPFRNLQWKKTPKRDYEKCFLELKGLFEENQLEKAVPVVIDQAELPGQDLRESFHQSLLFLFEQMAKLPETLHPFLLAHKEWLFGATPETLLLKKENRLRTHAVAGTTDDFSKDLLKDPKEMAEHNYVIKEIKKVLNEYGDVSMGKTYEKKIPGLKHLVTEIELQLLDDHSEAVIDMARRLHPTPALGGYPKGEAFKWLRSRPHAMERRRYGAPFGYVTSTGQSHILVAIRALQVIDQKLLSIAGAGVVKESVLDKEWNEIAAKKNSVFRIFEGSETR